MNHLLYFTIGPVQSFIAQARKTQDMYMGSQLLTQCIQDCINSLKTDKLFMDSTGNEVNIIFPHVLESKSENFIQSLPNRLMAKLTGISEKEAREIAESLHRFANNFLINAAAAVENREGIQLDQPFWDQIANYLDIQWVIHSYQGDDVISYKQAYQQVLQNMAATKYTRMFQPLVENQRFRKCSLSGEMDALIFGDYGWPAINPSKFVPGGTSDDAQNLEAVEPLLLRGEGLSSVQFVKRFFSKKAFPSTAQIALSYYQDRLVEARQGLLIKMLYKKFNYEGRDGETIEVADAQLLYPENHTLHYYRKHGLDRVPDYWKKDYPPEQWGEQFELDSSLQTLLDERLSLFEQIGRSAKKLKPEPKRTSYYAVLRFDADNMGDWWTGKDKAIKADIDLQKFHLSLAQCLANFGQKAREILDHQKNYGAVVFAGGDDFLGLICLQHLEKAVQELQTTFKELISDVLIEAGFVKEGQQLTFSAGLVITHYKVPLYEVMRVVDDAQYRAKKVAGKHGIAVEVIKHSGEVQRAAFSLTKWDNFMAIANGILSQGSSSRFVFHFSQAFEVLAGEQASYKLPSGYFQSEVSRILRRAGGKIDLETMQAQLIAVWNAVGQETTPFLHALHIIEFLQRQLTYDPQSKKQHANA